MRHAHSPRTSVRPCASRWDAAQARPSLQPLAAEGKALKSLCASVDCANVVEEWGQRYVSGDDRWQAHGLLFVYNHDGTFDAEEFGCFVEDATPANLRLTSDRHVFVFGPGEVAHLHNVARDLDVFRGKNSQNGISTEFLWFTPDLITRKSRTPSFGKAAPAEVLLGPWQIAGVAENGSGSPSRLRMYYRCRYRPTTPELEYLIEFLFRHRLLDYKITLCFLGATEDVLTAYQAAVNNVVDSLYGLAEFKKRLDQIEPQVLSDFQTRFTVDATPLGTVRVRYPEDERSRQIAEAMILKALGNPAHANRKTISLDGCTATQRTTFFEKLMQGIAGFSLRTVSRASFRRLDDLSSDADLDELPGKHDDEADARILRVQLDGREIFACSEFQQLTKSGFYVSGAVWRAREEGGDGIDAEFDASFTTSEEATSFGYRLRGIFRRKDSGEHAQTRPSCARFPSRAGRRRRSSRAAPPDLMHTKRFKCALRETLSEFGNGSCLRHERRWRVRCIAWTALAAHVSVSLDAQVTRSSTFIGELTA